MMTPDEAFAAQREHKLTLRQADDGWHAETPKGTRLHRGGRPTQEEAIEAAVKTIAETAVRNQEADGQRLFNLLASGRYYQRRRQIEIPSDIEGDPPSRVFVWDIRRMTDNTIIVQGERSLRAAIIEAERILRA